MQIINLRKHYYPQYKTNTFIKISDEVAEALLLMLRAENNCHQKVPYSLDAENDAVGWKHPSLEELFIQAGGQAHAELFLLRLEQALQRLNKRITHKLRANEVLGKAQNRSNPWWIARLLQRSTKLHLPGIVCNSFVQML